MKFPASVMLVGNGNLRRAVCRVRRFGREGYREGASVNFVGKRLLHTLALFCLLLFGHPAPAWAAVEMTFYSRELGGDNFPHAFVVLRGSVDLTGEPVDTSFGFTARAVTPAILFGSVAGAVLVEGNAQIARSDRQFAVTLSDARYRAVMAVVDSWRDRPQPSYNRNRRNCVHFVGELAQAAGLRVEYVGRLMQRPRSFLLHVRSLNPALAPAS